MTIARCSLAVALLALAHTAHAQTYTWIPWTSTGPASAAANVPSLGTVTATNFAQIGLINPSFPLQFDNVPFTPTAAPALGVSQPIFQNWSFELDFLGVASTSGLIVGLGNFGWNSPAYPGYRLEAFDALLNPIPLNTLGILGSYDHSWPTTSDQFNDDVTLNTVTGAFVPSVTPGLNDNNSDMLLFTLPGGVRKLVVSANDSAGDTVNVVLAIPSPAGVVTLAAAGLLTLRRRR